MPRGIDSDKTKQSKSRSATRNWTLFQKGQKKIIDENGNEFIPENGEIFVDMFWVYAKDKKDPKAKKVGEIDPQYKVSSKGNIISLKDRKMIVLSPKVDEKSGYVTLGESLKLHRVVWFSFAADAIRNPKERKGNGVFPEMHGLPENEKNPKIRDRRWLKKLLKYEVDHKDLNKTNNDISNLALMPKFENIILRDIDNASSDEEILKILSKIHEPTIILKGGGGKSHGIDDYNFKKNMSNVAKAQIYLKVISEGIINSILDDKRYGSEYLSETKYGMIHYGKENRYFSIIPEEKSYRFQIIPWEEVTKTATILYKVDDGMVEIFPD